MNQPLVSIIIPVYNSQKYIQQLMESIINQSYKNLEVICINDGSTDESEKVLNKYRFQDNRVKILSQKNNGAPSCRNLGLITSTGDYVIFFDSDDFFCDKAIENMIKVAQENNSDIVIGNKIDIIEGSADFIRTCEYNDEKILKYTQFFFLDPIPGNKLIKKSFLNQYKIVFENVKIGQDLCFYLKMLAHKPTINICTEDSMGYLIRKNSISRSYDKRILDILNVFNIINSYYKKNEIFSKFEKELEYNQVYHILLQISKLQYIKDKDLFNELHRKLVESLPKTVFKNIYIKNNKALLRMYIICRNKMFTKLFFGYREYIKGM